MIGFTLVLYAGVTLHSHTQAYLVASYNQEHIPAEAVQA